jgi:hypothetical protein
VTLIVRSSDIVRADRSAIQVARSLPDEIEVARPPILWPRYVRTGPSTGRTVFMAIPAAAIPAGWQSVRFTVPMRRATCAEVDCPMYLAGWTEIIGADGNRQPRIGHISRDEAAQVFGYYGPRSLKPQVKHHPPGLECGRVHKRPADIPPLYEVNGRPTLWHEFEDSLGGGVHRAQQIHKEGR